MHATYALLLFTQAIDRILLTLLIAIPLAAILNVPEVEEEIVKALVIPQWIARAAGQATLTILCIRISLRLTVSKELSIRGEINWGFVVLLSAVRVADNKIAVVHGTWVLSDRRVRFSMST
jgi:hypothetical protein